MKLTIRWTQVFALSASVLALAACAAGSQEPISADDQEEQNASEADLSTNAAKFVGAFKNSAAAMASGIQNIVFNSDGTFFASVDDARRIEGRYSATAKFVRLSPANGASADAAHGRYTYLRTGDKLRLSLGALTQELVTASTFCEKSNDCTLQTVGANVPACKGQGWVCTAESTCKFSCDRPGAIAQDSTRITAKRTGGLLAPGPAGSCTLGTLYLVDKVMNTLSWNVCIPGSGSGPYVARIGSRPMTARDIGAIERASSQVKPSSQTICGADKPHATLDVTSSRGTTVLADAFYACEGGAKTYVDNIKAVFDALDKLSL
jgi:hypothetical protein